MPHIILFYKYAPLSSDPDIMAMYQKAMYDLCETLSLTGRVLVGMSDNAEGINGTLAGEDKKDVLAYTYAMLGKDWCSKNDTHGIVYHSNCTNMTHENASGHNDAIHQFWIASEKFYEKAGIQPMTMDSPVDFKWSSVENNNGSKDSQNTDADGLFPDLQIKLVKEIIGTGGVLSNISIEDTSKGYLTPQQWHEEMKKLTESQSTSNGGSSSTNDTVLIDCRNHKEFEIGHFSSAVDPNTKTFEQFPRWVQQNKSALKDKKILMYCTGGIRCEKASAYIRNELESVSKSATVHHLQGGIHKYLDQFGAEGFFHGKNFVFDRRVGVDAKDHVDDKINGSSGNKEMVGKCLYCEKMHDDFTADSVCTVCREMTLVCSECKTGLNGEYHCADHRQLRHCYFTNLSRFSQNELASQLLELETLLELIAVGKRYKAKRRTLQKQILRVSDALSKDCIGDDNLLDSAVVCRSCGDGKCDGGCWGVHGLKRKCALEKKAGKRPKKAMRPNANKRSSKVAQREKDILEIKTFGLSKPCHVYRCEHSSIRCPPPFVRELGSLVKGKWVGKSVQSILQSEFHELAQTERLELLFKKSLIKLNGIPVNSEAALLKGVDSNKALSQDISLKNMDVITRLTHWHEPPVVVPEIIEVKKIDLPKEIVDEYLHKAGDSISGVDASLYCIGKPSTIPVHPTGPYLQNSMTLMVEAQEDLQPRCLLPCHRLDKCTSGLTICCTNPAVARLVQIQMDKKMVEKWYLARVKGVFPTSVEEVKKATDHFQGFSNWSMAEETIEIDAPIAVDDIMKGLRAVNENGKEAKSRFTALGHDSESDTSLVLCSPLTGRQHQLRVHLQFIGFPICNDTLYGGTQDAAIKDEKKEAALNALSNATVNDLSVDNEDTGITKEVICAAKETCLVCQGKAEDAFSSSQLLVDGHSIDLHAFRYRINFGKKKQEGVDEIIGAVVCKIHHLPDWTNLFPYESIAKAMN